MHTWLTLGHAQLVSFVYFAWTCHYLPTVAGQNSKDSENVLKRWTEPLWSLFGDNSWFDDKKSGQTFLLLPTDVTTVLNSHRQLITLEDAMSRTDPVGYPSAGMSGVFGVVTATVAVTLLLLVFIKSVGGTTTLTTSGREASTQECLLSPASSGCESLPVVLVNHQRNISLTLNVQGHKVWDSQDVHTPHKECLDTEHWQGGWCDCSGPSDRCPECVVEVDVTLQQSSSLKGEWVLHTTAWTIGS